jgi:eukaryotic-like serine/threonine-protein kinase
MKIRIQSLLSHRYFRRFLYLAASFVVLFILMNYIILPAYVYHGGTLKVPQVEGMTMDSAVELLERTDLTPVQSETRVDSRYPAGTVIQQNPPAESIVKPGRRVYLTLSGGEILVTVPQLRGLSTRDARFTLERYGLQMGTVSYATSQTYPENTIIEQTVQANTKVSKGTLVNVTVSRGMMTDEIAVPEVLGKTIGEAKIILTQKGLKLGNITYHFSDNLLPNTVVDQFPRPGDPVQRGQAIDLFVVREGKFKDKSEVP